MSLRRRGTAKRFFKLKDGERIVGAFSLDPRVAGNIQPRKEGAIPDVHAVGVTSDGYSMRFGLDPFVEPSTRSGRRFAKAADGAEVVGVAQVTGSEVLIAATREARAILTKADEVNFLSGPGRGVILIKLSTDSDRVLGFIASVGDRDLLTVETSRGAEQTISTAKYEVTGRGGKGRELLQRGQFTKVVWPLPEPPQPLSE
jgi:DNA gyrase/topoisomerase IV subunit A